MHRFAYVIARTTSATDGREDTRICEYKRIRYGSAATALEWDEDEACVCEA